MNATHFSLVSREGISCDFTSVVRLGALVSAIPRSRSTPFALGLGRLLALWFRFNDLVEFSIRPFVIEEVSCDGRWATCGGEHAAQKPTM